MRLTKILLGLTLSSYFIACNSPSSNTEESNSSNQSSSSYISSSSKSDTTIQSVGDLSFKINNKPQVIISSLLRIPSLGYPDGLLQLNSSNNGKSTQTIIITLNIPSINSSVSKTITLNPSQTNNTSLTPTLSKEAFAQLSQIQELNLEVSAELNGKLIFKETIPSKITSNDFMVWNYNDNGSLKTFENFIAGWVTPSTPKIEALIAEAKELLPGKSFSEYQSSPYATIYNVKITGIGGATDALGGAPDPFFILSGGNTSYKSATISNTSSSTQSWSTSFKLANTGTYAFDVYDEDVSTNDYMIGGSFSLPSSFFTNLDSQFIASSSSNSITLKAKWTFPVDEQVEAIYNALKARNLSYVNSSSVGFGGTNSNLLAPGEFNGQKIRFPDSSLASTNYNCIDGVVLFASLLETVGIKPYVVLIPGHAYLAWASTKDGSIMNALETTVLSKSSFQQANTIGLESFARDRNLSTTRIVDISQMRAQNYIPLFRKI